MGRSIVLIWSEEGAAKPENRGLALTRGCPLKEKALTTLLGVSATHIANTAAEYMSLMVCRVYS